MESPKGSSPSLYLRSDSVQTSHSSSWQIPPSDILVLVVHTLSTLLCETDAPFVCSHVCHYWREVIRNTPLLWTCIDISRGKQLTLMWLANAKDVRLNIRLATLMPSIRLLDYTRLCLFMPQNISVEVETTEGLVNQLMPRWTGLDIAFNRISETSKTLESLGYLAETLLLDYLTIGPGSQGILVIEDGSVTAYPRGQFPLADDSTTRPLFQRINVQPTILRVDTYPVAFSPIVFSSRLKILEVLTGVYYTHAPNVEDWHEILSHTPHLVRLRLWSSRHRPFDPIDPSSYTPLQLPFLQHLELVGAFNVLSPLFTKCMLPMLGYILIDFLSTSLPSSPNNVPQKISELVSVSPALTHLQVRSLCFNPSTPTRAWWAEIFQSTGLLRVLELVEMEWREVAIALEESTVSPNLSYIELRSIWDVDKDHLQLLLSPEVGLAKVTLVDCIEGQNGLCTNKDQCLVDGYCQSDTSSVYLYSGDSSSDPESDSEDSDLSYGDDEGSDMGKYTTNG